MTTYLRRREREAGMDGDVVKVELRGEGRWFSSSALTKWPLREGQIPFRLFFPSNDIYKKAHLSVAARRVLLYFICKGGPALLSIL
jgi:hypothetical protein